MPHDDPHDEGPDSADADLMDELDEGDVVSCPGCGSSVWYDAEKCPTCGQWVTRRQLTAARGGTGRFFRGVWLIAVIAIVLVLIGVGLIF